MMPMQYRLTMEMTCLVLILLAGLVKNSHGEASCTLPTSNLLSFRAGFTVVDGGSQVPHSTLVFISCSAACKALGPYWFPAMVSCQDGQFESSIPDPASVPELCTLDSSFIQFGIPCGTLFRAYNYLEFAGKVSISNGQQNCESAFSSAGIFSPSLLYNSLTVRSGCTLTQFNSGEAYSNNMAVLQDSSFTGVSCQCTCALPSSSKLSFETVPSVENIIPGTTIVIKCSDQCRTLGAGFPTTSTCGAAGHWSPPLPSDFDAGLCESFPEPPTSDTPGALVCATLFGSTDYQGSSTQFFTHPGLFCTNVYQVPSTSVAGSMTVETGCTVVAYKNVDRSGDQRVFSANTTDLDDFANSIASLACFCADEPYCAIPVVSAGLRYEVDEIAVDVYRPLYQGSQLSVECADPCIHEQQPSEATCQSDGTWSNAIQTDLCPNNMLVTNGRLCAKLYSEDKGTGNVIDWYEWQEPCTITKETIKSQLNSRTRSIEVQHLCTLTAYSSLADAVGTFQEGVYGLFDMPLIYVDTIERVSCVCQEMPVEQCPVPFDSRLAFSQNGAAVSSGSSIAFGQQVNISCTDTCKVVNDSFATVTCSTDDMWDPALPTSFQENICSQDVPIVATGLVCAMLFNQENFMGSSLAIYSGQQACTNVADYLGATFRQSTRSIEVSPNCQLTLHPYMYTIQSSSSSIPMGLNNILSVACHCYCTIPQSQVLWFNASNGDPLTNGSLVAIGSDIQLSCNDSQKVLGCSRASTTRCDVNATFSPAIPADSEDGLCAFEDNNSPCGVTTPAVTTAAPMPCMVPVGSNLLRYQLGGLVINPGQTVPSGQSVTIACTTVCGWLGSLPSFSSCTSTGDWVPALTASNDRFICQEPVISSTSAKCATLFVGINFQGPSLEVANNQQACTNVLIAFQRTMGRIVRSVIVQPGCRLSLHGANPGPPSLHFETVVYLPDSSIWSFGCSCSCFVPSSDVFVFKVSNAIVGTGTVRQEGSFMTVGCKRRCHAYSPSWATELVCKSGVWVSSQPSRTWSFTFAEQNRPCLAIVYNRIKTCAQLHASNGRSATVYSDEDLCFAPQQLGGSQVSSITVESGCTLTVYGSSNVGGSSPHFTTSSANLGVWANKIEAASCSCALPCIIPFSATRAVFKLNGVALSSGSRIAVNQQIEISCRLPFAQLGSNPSSVTCNGDGSWSPQIPTDSKVGFCIEPPVITSGIKCADGSITKDQYQWITRYRDGRLEEERIYLRTETIRNFTFYHNQNAQSNVKSDLIGQHDNTMTLRASVRKHCELTVYHTLDLGSYHRYSYGNEKSFYPPEMATASCFCRETCLVPSSTVMKYYVDGQLVQPNSEVARNSVMRIACADECRETQYSNDNFQCIGFNQWNEQGIVNSISESFCTEKALATGPQLCATLYTELFFGGSTLAIFSGQLACPIMARHLEGKGFHNRASSLKVIPGCTATLHRYDAGVTVTRDFTSSQLDLGDFTRKVSLLSCHCPPTTVDYCKITKAAGYDFQYDGFVVDDGFVAVGGSVTVKCKCVPWGQSSWQTTLTCQSGGKWSPTMPLCNTISNLPTGSKKCATVYKDANFQNNNFKIIYDGQADCDKVTDYLNGLQTSSVIVEPGCTLIGSFKNKNDRYVRATYSGYVKSLGDYNDKFTSFSCYCLPKVCGIPRTTTLVDKENDFSVSGLWNSVTGRTQQVAKSGPFYFSMDSQVLDDGNWVAAGFSVSATCRCSLNVVKVSTCGADGKWRPELPSSSSSCKNNGGLKTSGSACAYLYKDSNYSTGPLTVYHGQGSCEGVTQALKDRKFNNVVSSIKMVPGCIFNGYENHDRTGLSFRTTDSIVNLKNVAFNDKLSTMSCLCPTGCRVPLSSQFLFSYDGSDLADGAVIRPGQSIEIRCKCSRNSNTFESTCNQDGTWSPALFRDDEAPAKCGSQPAVVTTGQICAILYEHESFRGKQKLAYSGQQSCSNFAGTLNGFGGVSSLVIRKGCDLKAYDANGRLLLTSSAKLLSSLDGNNDKLATVSCNCMAQPHCEISYDAANYDISGDLRNGGYWRVTESAFLRCSYDSYATRRADYGCKANGVWNPSLPSCRTAF